MGQSVCVMGETSSQGWGEESMKDKTGREGLSSRVDVFMQRNKHEPRSNSNILGVAKQRKKEKFIIELGCQDKSLYFITWERENLLKNQKQVLNTDMDLYNRV